MQMKRILAVLCCMLALAGCGKTTKGKSTTPPRETAVNKDEKGSASQNSNTVNNKNNKAFDKQKASSEVNKESKPSACSINTPEKAIHAVEKYTKVYASKDISYHAEQRKGNTYNVFSSSEDIKKKGGSGTVGNYLVDACSGNIWNVSDLIPNEMVGTWSNRTNGNKIEYTITNYTIKTGGKLFVLDVCEANPNNKNITYTISWKLDDFKKQYGYTPVGPQPFIMTYNEQSDTITLSDNIILKRDSK